MAGPDDPVLRRRRRLGGQRQVDAERGPATRLALHLDAAAALLHDAVDHRQAQAGPLADLLCREKRLEQPLQDVCSSMPQPLSVTVSTA